MIKSLMIKNRHSTMYLFLATVLWSLAACSVNLPPAPKISSDLTPVYLIGPGDNLTIFVWGNPELSANVPVRPDGRITTPLIEDVQASGKSSTQLARDMEKRLAKFVKNPVVTVYITDFVGRFKEQIRVIGAATRPQALPYREGASLLDIMIAVGGLNEFADGNSARLIRNINGKNHQYVVRLDSLIKDGDISANVELLPGDVLLIPEAWF